MANLLVELEPVPAATSSRSKKRLLVRGLRRKAIKELKTKLQKLVNMDEREELRSQRFGYTALLFRPAPRSRFTSAVALLGERCDELLNARG